MLDLPLQMSPDQFQVLVQREHEQLELKTGAGRRPLQESLVALTNTEGGAILIGVNDQREIIGRRRDQGLDDDIHGAVRDAHNVGRYEIRQIQVGDRSVVAVLVHPRSDEVAQTSDGRVLVRRGGHRVALFGRELLALLASRSLVRCESTDSGVPVEAVDRTVAVNVAQTYGWIDAHHHLVHWRERGLLHDSGNLTVAGALILTDPAASLAAAKFHIDVRVYEDERSPSYVFRTTVGGPVQSQVEPASRLIMDRIGTEIVITGSRRHDLPRLPQRVVRETVANAVAHRSYELDASPIVIEIRPGLVAVTSPGRLPPPATLETLRQDQAPRNHTVIEVLRRFGLAEDSGQGIDVIQDAMRFEMLGEPLFSEVGDTFRVELPLNGLMTTAERAWLLEYERTGTMLPQDRGLLLAVLRDGRLTNARAREALGVDSTEARSRLRRLCDAGLLEQHGTRGRAYYTLGSLGPERSERQIVLEAAASGPLTNERVRVLTGLDRLAARALLRQLVDEGSLQQHGERKGTTYTISHRA